MHTNGHRFELYKIVFGESSKALIYGEIDSNQRFESMKRTSDFVAAIMRLSILGTFIAFQLGRPGAQSSSESSLMFEVGRMGAIFFSCAIWLSLLLRTTAFASTYLFTALFGEGWLNLESRSAKFHKWRGRNKILRIALTATHIIFFIASTTAVFLALTASVHYAVFVLVPLFVQQ